MKIEMDFIDENPLLGENPTNHRYKLERRIRQNMAL